MKGMKGARPRGEILVIRVLKRRVEEFLTWETKNRRRTKGREQETMCFVLLVKPSLVRCTVNQSDYNKKVETHSPNRRSEAQHGSLHSIRDEGNDVFPQTRVPVQSPEDVQSMDLRRHTTGNV
ncbi:hypothetical protein EYF80_023288 [Liparis tanakae]|uniref:Uncharacterized protein n=1 Tax=Liparis tanakae TaxID=230148 RepID=A0A4Z2HMI8_9TELE|nr:hypothetical protein EYF80_023288 [Liparis tanakae]